VGGHVAARTLRLRSALRSPFSCFDRLSTSEKTFSPSVLSLSTDGFGTSEKTFSPSVLSLSKDGLGPSGNPEGGEDQERDDERGPHHLTSSS
jgi:hypothetical protein